ncbi:Abscisic acid 8'-hydroxylase 1 [Platanthera zijinensis]|uniref:Abscisic acid 8'-hydroxylase 1 n=1 Tax=Platanthera zijinensis TaxID=2320716 RepID=A0AAP0G4K8_9ASPA
MVREVHRLREDNDVLQRDNSLVIFILSDKIKLHIAKRTFELHSTTHDINDSSILLFSLILALMALALVFCFIHLPLHYGKEGNDGGYIRQGKCRQRPPPGSMGWPYIRKMFQLHSDNPNNFFEEKQRR